MDLNTALQLVRSRIAELSAGGVTGLDAESILTRICQEGIVSDQDVPELTAQCLVDCGFPRRAATRLAKEINPPKEAPRSSRLRAATVERMSIDECINELDLRNPQAALVRKLRETAGQKACIALDTNGGIHRAATRDVFANLEAGVEISAPYCYKGKFYRLVPLGWKQPRRLHVNPWNTEKTLRHDGTDDYGNAWASLPEQVRALLIIALHHVPVKRKLKTKYDDIEAMAELFDKLSTQGVEYFVRFQPAAFAKYSDEGLRPPLYSDGSTTSFQHPAHA